MALWAEVRAALRHNDALNRRATAQAGLPGAPIDLDMLQIDARLIIDVAVAAKGGAPMRDSSCQRPLDARV